jgi:hypothetical protein
MFLTRILAAARSDPGKMVGNGVRKRCTRSHRQGQALLKSDSLHKAQSNSEIRSTHMHRKVKVLIARWLASHIESRTRRLRRALRDHQRAELRRIRAADRRARGLRLYAAWSCKIDVITTGSRARNNDNRGNNTNTGDILFDQILFPAILAPLYVNDSLRIFDAGVAIEGTGGQNGDQASDHLPVFADFVFGEMGGDNGGGETPVLGVRIASLLANPCSLSLHADRGAAESRT